MKENPVIYQTLPIFFLMDGKCYQVQHFKVTVLARTDGLHLF